MGRYFVDCRAVPSESNCSLYISGTKDEVINAAAEHAVSVHQHEDNAELREMLAGAVQEEAQPVGTALV
jgi:Protein of unknown function (DUF1059)